MKLPGASGWVARAFAGLPTPATEGAVGFVCSVPPMACAPCSFGRSSCASTVITTDGLELIGCQVALQWPSFKDDSGSEGSPSENEAVTLPLVRKFPQSSTTITSTAVGHAATVAKSAPSCVNTGINLVGVHPGACACAAVLPDPLAGVTTISTSMCREV